ncbi:MAG: HupE/UreJ family protein [Pseudomonadota bacterium]|nr:HupE/UreJ family protein [Pseudomonadota bacterium]
MSWLRAWPVLLALLVPSAYAHKPSDAYLTLHREGQVISGQWDIALRDLDAAIGLDVNGDGEISWGEVRSKQTEIDAYALSRIAVRSAGEPCTMQIRDHLIDDHTDGTYAVLMLAGRCPAAAPTLQVDYTLLFDIDPQHRGLLNFVEDGQSRSFVFPADRTRQSVGGDTSSVYAQFSAYVREGTWHIWLGYDHILFLLSLLLPAVLVREGSRWLPARSFKSALIDVAKVVTAFTVAHSITLSLAVLGIVSLPSRWVESAIALSVVLAALNNLRPVVGHSRWVAAFAFGLLHGFGFAGALQDLGLPTGSLAVSLFGFNVGVELGQLALVAVFLPIAYATRSTRAYRQVAFLGGSAAVAVIATVWFAERAFDVPLFAALSR